MVSLGKIDLNLFVVLEAIFNEGSITRASRTLNLTQPAVSHALARLRDLLNDPLFTREGNRMIPTPLTRQLIGPVTGALRAMSGALAQLDGFDPATSRKHFRIGVRHTVEPAVLPALAGQIHDEAPGVEVSTLNHDRDQLRSAFASGEVDVVIDIQIPPVPDIRFRRLYGGKLVVALRKDHPALQDAWDLGAYLRCDHISASSRRSAVGYEDHVLQEIGRQRRIGIRCQNQWTACRLAAASDLIFTLPERFVEAYSAPSGNVILPFPLPLPTFYLYLYWHARTEDDPATRWLRDKIIGLYGEEA
ncbi:MAG TPA: LysR family transcriptional regulator [Xanthobacteraceae bacterium]